MKYHAEFHHIDLAGNLVPACGDRSVVILDGRISSEAMHAIAADECDKRGYVAYRIMRGDRFTTATLASRVIRPTGTALELIGARLNA